MKRRILILVMAASTSSCGPDEANCTNLEDASAPGCFPADAALKVPSADGASGGTGGAGGATGGTDGAVVGTGGAVGGVDAAAPGSEAGTPDLAVDSASLPDAAVDSASLPDAAADTAPAGSISSGKYKAVTVMVVDDGCRLDPVVLVSMNTNFDAWLPVEVAGGMMKVGNEKGAPSLPSLGVGAYVPGAPFKLTRMNHVKVSAPSTCEYDEEVTSTITADAIDSFGMAVVDKQINRTNCVEPAGVGASCASTWSWRMVKSQ